MKYCIANWKMNMNYLQIDKYLDTLENLCAEETFNKSIAMIVCPPHTSLHLFGSHNRENRRCDFLKVGIQNFHFKNKGAYTGENSLDIITSVHPEIGWAIIGHSERRVLFNESNEFINLKVKSALENDITPILCIGETLSERESGNTEEVLYRQLKHCLSGTQVYPLDKDFLIAYEPIWAIGTGKTADNDMIELANDMIVKILKSLKPDIKNPKILYGGSVNNNNAENLSKICNLDGFLIGGASLDAEQFYFIYNALKGE